jgi:NAD dependent epimerase/dehydratase family enzyme
MADELFLASVRAYPRKLIATGYDFQYSKLEEALRYVLNL